MKTLTILIFALLLTSISRGQIRTIHVFVSLCDNENQGIVPVPKSLGNGKDTKNNLYWGAAYGVKSFFKNKASDWQLVSTLKSDNPAILERILFKHKTENVFMLADAYNGEKIKQCTEDFLKASNGQESMEVPYQSENLKFRGGSNLVAYVGHDGLMDFTVDLKYNEAPEKQKDVIILACFSKVYFSDKIKKTGANPVLWTTHLMSPEAYTLEAALDGWVLNENQLLIKERAAQAYHKYQRCGIKGARNLFTTGF